MIDIHHHCLPNVDDGPRSWEDALSMCRMAADEGIETIVATPHVLRGLWPQHSPAALAARLAELQEKCGDAPRLLLGSEYYFGHDMVETLGRGDAIVPLAGGRFVLLELAADQIPPLFEQPLYRAQLEGWTPVIAHPERNLVYQRHPELLVAHVARGAKAQITAGSLLGDFGKPARVTAEKFLKMNAVHFVATDAHNTERRSPRIRPALEALRSLVDEKTVRALTVDNPLAVVENRTLPWDPEPLDRPGGGLLTSIRTFFSSRQD